MVLVNGHFYVVEQTILRTIDMVSERYGDYSGVQARLIDHNFDFWQFAHF